MRFTGHLDLFRAWIRLFRRAKLQLAYTQGFHPQPRINLACALPLGFTSECEVIDAWLEEDLPLEQIEQAAKIAAPPGIKIQNIQSIDLRLPALQTQVLSAVYRITILDPVPDLALCVKALIDSTSLLRQRNNRRYDLRPLVESLELIQEHSTGESQLLVRLSAREGATGRPDEVISALEMEGVGVLIHRTRIIFTS